MIRNAYSVRAQAVSCRRPGRCSRNFTQVNRVKVGSKDSSATYSVLANLIDQSRLARKSSALESLSSSTQDGGNDAERDLDD